MDAQDVQTEFVTVDLGDDVTIQMEVLATGEEEVGVINLPIEELGKALTKIAQVMAAPIKAVKPTKATIKYGIAVTIQDGSLMAAIVRGTGTANLEVTLEWAQKSGKET